MRVSSTYQAILAEGLSESRAKGLSEGLAKGQVKGELHGLKEALRHLGDEAFGPPDARGRTHQRLSDLARVKEMLTRIRSAASWQELLGPSASGRTGGRRR